MRATVSISRAAEIAKLPAEQQAERLKPLPKGRDRLYRYYPPIITMYTTSVLYECRPFYYRTRTTKPACGATSLFGAE